MGFDKVLELVQTYAVQYVYATLAILTRPSGSEQEGSAERVLTPANPQTWVFALVSITLGSLAQAAAASANFNNPGFDPLSFGAVITLWLWILFAVVSHLTAKLLRGRGTFLDTLGVCLRVLPVTYMICSFAGLTVSLFARAITSHYAVLAVDTFLVAQFLMLAVYLPRGLRHAHKSGLAVQLVMTLLLPAMVLGVNVALSGAVIRPMADRVPVELVRPPPGRAPASPAPRAPDVATTQFHQMLMDKLSPFRPPDPFVLSRVHRGIVALPQENAAPAVAAAASAKQPHSAVQNRIPAAASAQRAKAQVAPAAAPP